MNILTKFSFICLILAINAKPRLIAIDESWVCNIKRSCLDCLVLSQCTWCKSENKCFSRQLPTFEGFCKDNSTEYVNYDLSFLENAKCSCAGGYLEENCYPPGMTTGQKCSGRGECVCGRCVCNAKPDPEHPTKMIVGQFCEYDNFSCEDGCNEGPYNYLQFLENQKNQNVTESPKSTLPPE